MILLTKHEQQELLKELRYVSAVAKKRRQIRYMLDPESFNPAFKHEHQNDHCIGTDDLYRIERVTELIALLIQREGKLSSFARLIQSAASVLMRKSYHRTYRTSKVQ